MVVVFDFVCNAISSSNKSVDKIKDMISTNFNNDNFLSILDNSCNISNIPLFSFGVAIGGSVD